MEFFGLIIWLFILILIFVSKINKRKFGRTIMNKDNPGKIGQVNPPAIPVQTKKHDQWENFNQSGNSYKQQELKQRLSDKYDRTEKKEVLSKLKATAKINSLEGEDKEDLMTEIGNILAKGPDLELPFGRDFIAEGMDMLNSIQSI